MGCETNLSIKQGATYTYVMTLLDDAGDAINLTGADIRMQIRQEVADLTSIYDASTTIGNIVVLVAASGTATLTISAAETADFDFAGAYYDVFVTVGGVVYRPLAGHVDLSLSVTREAI